MQEEINIKSPLLAKLLELKGFYRGNNLMLAQKLRITREHLSRIKSEESLDGPIGALLEYVYREAKGVASETPAKYRFSPVFVSKVESWAKRARVTPEQFIEGCTMTVGETTCRDMESFNPIEEVPRPKSVGKELKRPVKAPTLPQWAKYHPDAIVVADANANPIWVNEAFTKLSGHKLEDFEGKRMSQVLQSPETDQKAASSMRNAILSGKENSVEILNQNKDGSVYVTRIELSPVFNSVGDVVYFVAVQQDVKVKTKVDPRKAVNELASFISNAVEKEESAANRLKHQLEAPTGTGKPAARKPNLS